MQPLHFWKKKSPFLSLGAKPPGQHRGDGGWSRGASCGLYQPPFCPLNEDSGAGTWLLPHTPWDHSVKDPGLQNTYCVPSLRCTGQSRGSLAVSPQQKAGSLRPPPPGSPPLLPWVTLVTLAKQTGREAEGYGPAPLCPTFRDLRVQVKEQEAKTENYFPRGCEGKRTKPNSGTRSTLSASRDKIGFCLHPSAGSMRPHGPELLHARGRGHRDTRAPRGHHPTYVGPEQVSALRCPNGPVWANAQTNVDMQQCHQVPDRIFSSPTAVAFPDVISAHPLGLMQLRLCPDFKNKSPCHPPWQVGPDRDLRSPGGQC